MAGALGLCFRGRGLSEGDLAQMSHEIDIYKTFRATLSVASAALLTAQAAIEGGPDWDALQETASGGAQHLVWAFQSNDGVDTITVRPTGLVGEDTYEVRSVDLGLIGEATGADLMAKGIEVIASPNTAAHILILTPK